MCAVRSALRVLIYRKKKELRNHRIFEKILSEKEQDEVLFSTDQAAAFYKYWARKESFLKLTGQGITVDLRGISKPVWQEDFTLKEVYAGCISADTECQVTYEHILPFDLLKFFS